jgi:glycosyltransferase 2 family protein
VGILILSLTARKPFWKNIIKKLPNKVSEIIVDFAQYWGSAALGKAFLLAIIFSLVGIAGVNYVLFWSLGIKVGIINYLTVIFLISFISALPVSINNIGIKEWAYVTFFGFFGVSASAVITVALLSRILQMVVSFTALPAYLKSKK